MINPVKLKQQCDGSVEVFSYFREMMRRLPKGDDPENFCLKGTISFAFGVSIKYARNSLGLGISHDLDETELAYIVKAPSFFDFTFTIDVVDSLIKNFICYFRDKLVELCNLCEEELYSLIEETQRDGTRLSWQNHPAKRAPNFANLNFKTFLEVIATLYEYPNCEGLYDFVFRNRAISAPTLKIAYLSMLTSLYSFVVTLCSKTYSFAETKPNTAVMCSKPSALFTNRLVNCNRFVSRSQTQFHPVSGKKPPTLDEFDPLNPGEWQLGAFGKILPRLPEGTRCGKLVMGKYGLYSPKIRAIQEDCYPKHEAGVSTEVMTPTLRRMRDFLLFSVVLSVFLSAHNFAMLIWGTKEKPLWPYSWLLIGFPEANPRIGDRSVLCLLLYLWFNRCAAQIIYDSPPIGVSLTRPVLPWLARYFVGAGRRVGEDPEAVGEDPEAVWEEAPEAVWEEASKPEVSKAVWEEASGAVWEEASGSVWEEVSKAVWEVNHRLHTWLRCPCPYCPLRLRFDIARIGIAAPGAVYPITGPSFPANPLPPVSESPLPPPTSVPSLPVPAFADFALPDPSPPVPIATPFFAPAPASFAVPYQPVNLPPPPYEQIRAPSSAALPFPPPLATQWAIPVQNNVLTNGSLKPKSPKLFFRDVILGGAMPPPPPVKGRPATTSRMNKFNG
uniref:Uncharacterized protein n=1 Tax=Globodera rostochiensis TaxID=31243 RepID=A0A914HDJ1_GLORO